MPCKPDEHVLELRELTVCWVINYIKAKVSEWERKRKREVRELREVREGKGG